MRVSLSEIKNNNSPLDQFVNRRLSMPDLQIWRKCLVEKSDFFKLNRTAQNLTSREILIDGRRCKSFGSCAYLGFDKDRRLRETAIKAIEKHGNHIGIARAMYSQEEAIDLEKTIATFVGAEKALLGSSISLIHAGVVDSLFASSDTQIYLDVFSHTSMRMAAHSARSKGAKVKTLNLRDLKNCEAIMGRSERTTKVLMIDTVQSMQGTILDLQEIQKIFRKNNVILYLDDAHGTGVLGHNGSGAVAELDISFDNTILIGSFAKGFSCYGGYIAGNASLIDILQSGSLFYVFSGPLQPQAIATIAKAIEISSSKDGQELRSKLSSLTSALRDILSDGGMNISPSPAPIVAIPTGSDERTAGFTNALFDRGIYAPTVLYPAVPQGQGCLRVSLTCLHTHEDVNLIGEALVETNSQIM